MNVRILKSCPKTIFSINVASRNFVINRRLSDYGAKYREKLQRQAEKTGQTIDELIEKSRTDEKRKNVVSLDIPNVKLRPIVSEDKKRQQQVRERKDAPPFKALADILNFSAIFSTPHSAEQISSLWSAYHMSRSNGTGRGYICASIPLNIFLKMAEKGRSYPTFVIPVPRIQNDDVPDSADTLPKSAHEFYYLQWDFYSNPRIPNPFEDSGVLETAQTEPNLQVSTVLFTPLQEYKSRNVYAVPYLVLTMYTDLAASHGIVLMRGEITPSSAAGKGHSDAHLLSQEDAQLLAMKLQEFYLWNEGNGNEQSLLRSFHEKPQDFDWNDILKSSKLKI